MAQDPEDRDQEQPLTSRALDMVTLYNSTTVDSEMEADVIRGVLDTNGIPSVVQRAGPYPPLGIQVLVPRGRLQEAQELLEEAQAGGPEAAAEAEAASEEP
jgi:hypothetical protein